MEKRELKLGLDAFYGGGGHSQAIIIQRADLTMKNGPRIVGESFSER